MEDNSPWAVISECGKYRYTLRRLIEPFNNKKLVFVMLNPSTADAVMDDPTIRRCKGFAARLGFGKLEILNLFAWRSTNPRILKEISPDIVEGVFNKDYFFKSCQDADSVIVAWGNHGILYNQDLKIMSWLNEMNITPYCFGISKNGSPCHPLYLKKDSKPIPYQIRGL